jgi:hypothetical protein
MIMVVIGLVPSVMIEKFAIVSGEVSSEFLDLNHTSKAMILVSLMIPKFAPDPAANSGELRNRDTRGFLATGDRPGRAQNCNAATEGRAHFVS